LGNFIDGSLDDYICGVVMGIIKATKRLFSRRNLAVSDIYQISTGLPVFSNFTVSKAVKDGYQASPTVYRAVTLITKSASSVPWIVVDEEGEPLPDHPLTRLFQAPNPHISRQDLFELLISWILLTGNSYCKKTKVGQTTAELWPISPDRIKVKPSKNVEEWLQGYILDQDKQVTYEPNELVHFKAFNPANPLLGIGPLEAVGKTVDVDVDQQKWNKAAMQNRGVLDGIISLDRDLDSQEDADILSDKLNESLSGAKNARRLRVLGSNAKYLRTAATPIEMDFSESRKENRNEIFITFGVPPQYAGVQESSTYNNYQTSELIFWISTVLPLLDDMSDTFTFSFRDELKPGQRVTYNRTGVQALRRALEERAKVANYLFRMGVPFDQINSLFQFGVEEYDGWEKSYVSSTDSGKSSLKDQSSPTDKEDEEARELLKKKFPHILRKEQR
jgi:HK97 family phage portal protein